MLSGLCIVLCKFSTVRRFGVGSGGCEVSVGDFELSMAV